MSGRPRANRPRPVREASAPRCAGLTAHLAVIPGLDPGIPRSRDHRVGVGVGVGAGDDGTGRTTGRMAHGPHDP